MDRYALFVDAGYLYAEGGKLCCGTPSRLGFTLDVADFNLMLRTLAGEHCGLNLLRTYWYDGARDGIRTAVHQEIAALPNVKLRLGGINHQGQQKGVDALVYRDLMTLAHAHAISDAFILAGDEDVREGVRTAQDQGVRVIVIGIDSPFESANQSRELVFEADEIITLTREAIESFFTAISQPAPAEPQTAGGVSDVGASFAGQWLQEATEYEFQELLAQRPRIPRPLDIELLRHTEHVLGISLAEDDAAKRSLRRAFWDTVTSGFPTHDAGASGNSDDTGAPGNSDDAGAPGNPDDTGAPGNSDDTDEI